MNASAISRNNFRLRFLSPSVAIGAGSCVVFSLEIMLAEWVALFWIFSCLAVLWATYRRSNEFFSYNFRLISTLLLISLAIAAHWAQGWQYVLAQALVLMLGIKLLELRTQRDCFQFCGLGVLGLGVSSLVRFDLGFGVMIFLFFFLGLVLTLWQHIVDQTGTNPESRNAGWFFPLKIMTFALFLTVMTIVLGLFLFFVFPRNINPMLNLSSGMNIHRTGFSPQMRPGSVGEIVLSGRVAFRATIDGDADPSMLYWRGAVLWETDGTSWKPGSPNDHRVRPAIASGNESGVISQNITLNPGRTEYLFGLFFPGMVQNYSPVYYSRDATIITRDPVDIAIRYQVYSRRSDKTELTPQELRAALDVPSALDPGVISLAREFEDVHDPWNRAQEVLKYFGTSGFEYSLVSPGGSGQGQTLASFLLETRTGYCELYAAATAVLLRLNNIPSRIVVGFMGGEFNPVGEYWVVRDSMAHAWVEAWFEDRGWVLLDPTAMLDGSAVDQAEQAWPSPASGEIIPEQLMSPGLRVVDWMRWQWTNAIIDLTPARQMRMWRSLRSGFQETWTGLSAPRANVSRNFPEGFSLSPVLGALIIGAGFIIVLWALKGRYSGMDRDQILRIRAWKRLSRKTPGRHELLTPGRERSILDWWERNHPDKALELKIIYHAQRYGPSPDLEKDKKLKSLLSGMYTRALPVND